MSTEQSEYEKNRVFFPTGFGLFRFFDSSRNPRKGVEFFWFTDQQNRVIIVYRSYCLKIACCFAFGVDLSSLPFSPFLRVLAILVDLFCVF